MSDHKLPGSDAVIHGIYLQGRINQILDTCKRLGVEMSRDGYGRNIRADEAEAKLARLSETEGFRLKEVEHLSGQIAEQAAELSAVKAACAEMRAALERLAEVYARELEPDDAGSYPPEPAWLRKARSSEAGKGWVNPEELEKILGRQTSMWTEQLNERAEETEKLRAELKEKAEVLNRSPK